MVNQSELVLLAQKQDEQAFTMLYESVYKDLYHIAFYTLQNQHDAEDVVSETVLDAYMSLKKLRDPDAFKSWIFKILSNKCKHKMKQYYKKTVSLEESNNSSYEMDYIEKSSIYAAFSLLSKEERLIVSLYTFSGYKGREISDILHKKHSTIRSKYNRALVKMKKYLEKEIL